MLKKADFIIESQRKCREAGMDPTEVRKPKVIMSDIELSFKRKSYSEILSVVSFFSEKLLKDLKGTPILIVISDENGFLLEMVGDETIKSTIKQLGIDNGVQFSQEDSGTNVITLALQQKEPISLIGDDHYHNFLHGTACYGAAFSYTDENNLLGSISIMTAIELQNPLFKTMLGHIIDNIERELLLLKQNKKLNIMNQIMLSRTRNGIIISDNNGIVTEFNDFAEDISGYKKEEVIGKSIFNSIITGKYFKDVITNSKKYENIEMKFMNNDGEYVVCLFDAQPIFDESGKSIGAFGQFRDITERFKMQEKFNYLAYHDELTGLPNRRYMQDKLENIFSEEGDKKIALMFLDLDRFKLINDTFGHKNGDLLLKKVTKRLKSCIRGTDTLARMSGDEFIILLEDFIDDEDVTNVAERVVKQFEEPFEIINDQFYTTASVGVAIYPNDGTNLEKFMIYADNAMYKAKTQGKNGYFIYTPDMHDSVNEKLVIEHHLRIALEKNEFILHYQPQVNIKTGKIIGLEALVRWKHPELGLVSPGKFIPIAEETGLIVPIGEWVLEEACRQNKKWQDMGLPPVKVAVNLSTQQFLRQNLTKVVESVLEKTGLQPKYLELEITETMAMDFDYAVKILNQLRDLGVKISMDDFGTGYSSLNYLKNFSINYLKIDKSFVNDILIDKNDANIVSTIIAMAHNLGLKVIAEGVETKEQLSFLRSQKCDEVQGFYFMKPMSADIFEKDFVKFSQEIIQKNTH